MANMALGPRFSLSIKFGANPLNIERARKFRFFRKSFL